MSCHVQLFARKSWAATIWHVGGMALFHCNAIILGCIEWAFFLTCFHKRISFNFRIIWGLQKNGVGYSFLIAKWIMIFFKEAPIFLTNYFLNKQLFDFYREKDFHKKYLFMTFSNQNCCINHLYWHIEYSALYELILLLASGRILSLQVCECLWDFSHGLFPADIIIGTTTMCM